MRFHGTERQINVVAGEVLVEEQILHREILASARVAELSGPRKTGGGPGRIGGDEFSLGVGQAQFIPGHAGAAVGLLEVSMSIKFCTGLGAALRSGLFPKTDVRARMRRLDKARRHHGDEKQNPTTHVREVQLAKAERIFPGRELAQNLTESVN